MTATPSTWFTLSEAADLSDRSRATLRRYLDQGRFPNARRDEDDVNRSWLIPLSDLLEAGVKLHGTTPYDTGGSTTSHVGDARIVERLMVAEALAAERLAEIERLSRMVEAMSAQSEAITALIVERSRPPAPSTQGEPS